MKIPYGGRFGTNREGRIIAIGFKKTLNPKQFKYLQEWWAKYIEEQRDDNN